MDKSRGFYKEKPTELSWQYAHLHEHEREKHKNEKRKRLSDSIDGERRWTECQNDSATRPLINPRKRERDGESMKLRFIITI